MKTSIALSLLIFLIINPTISQSQEMIIPNGDLQIGGTLEAPDEPEFENLLVILITGSGAQDRDETIVGFKPFKLIADYLAAEGVPNFRYDDRSIGSSTGDFAEATLDHLANDVIAIIDHFKGDYEEFILLGHSQGGPVASRVAAKDTRVSGIVYMGASMVPLYQVIDEQVLLIQNAMGKSEEDVRSIMDFQTLAYETARKNEGWDELKIAYKKLIELEVSKLPEAQQAYITDIDAFAEAQFTAQVAPFKAPQMRSLLHYDPIPDLVKANIPSIGIFGGKDTQVTVSQNETTYTKACEDNNLDCSVTNFPEANHLFQPANTGMVNEYPTLPKEFVDGFLESVSEWIAEKF